MKLKYLLILLIIAVDNLSIYADENAVDVRKTDKCISVYARGTGSGYTLMSAKTAAINNIMPLLIEKTQDLPGSLQNTLNVNGVETGEGADKIAAKMLFIGSWELENGIYLYTIQLRIDNTNEVEKPQEATNE